MERLIVTQVHLDYLVQKGACNERLSLYKPGMTLQEIKNTDLLWIKNNLPSFASSLEDKLSTYLLSGRLLLEFAGDGDGYGYSYGYSDGHGYSDGYGYGGVDGDGYGDGGGGDGYGYGYDYGYNKDIISQKD